MYPDKHEVCLHHKTAPFWENFCAEYAGAHYCRAYDSAVLFDKLDISKSETYAVHLNRYNVINLCLNHLPDQCSIYEAYIGHFRNAIRCDILEAYPGLADKEFDSSTDLLTATENRFIFIIDEWGVNEAYRGVYYIENAGFFQTQVIVAKELDEGNYIWLKDLTDNIGKEQARPLLHQSGKLMDKPEAGDVESVLQTASKANRKVF